IRKWLTMPIFLVTNPPCFTSSKQIKLKIYFFYDPGKLIFWGYIRNFLELNAIYMPSVVAF
ncbi:MAG: hypothetical protein ACWGNI_06355, partial [Desulfobacterales bacterium]